MLTLDPSVDDRFAGEPGGGLANYGAAVRRMRCRVGSAGESTPATGTKIYTGFILLVFTKMSVFSRTTKHKLGRKSRKLFR